MTTDTNLYDSDSYASVYRPEKSIFQDDTRIFHRRGFAYDTVAAVENAAFADGVLTAALRLQSGHAAYLTLTPIAEGIVRLRFWQGAAPSSGEGEFEDTSMMLAPGFVPAPPTTGLTEDEDAFELVTGEYTLRLLKAPFNLHILRGDDLVFELETEELAGQFVTPPLGVRRPPQDTGARLGEAFLSWRIRNDERFFGLGEKWNKVEKTSTRATIWAADTCGANTTDMSYKSLPVLFSTKGWGLMLHSAFRSYWEVGLFSYTSGSALIEEPKVDAFLFLAPTLAELVVRYTDLTGKPQMPPRWALGIWMSRCAYRNREQVEDVLRRLRDEQIPCDVVHLDPPWMRTHYYPVIGVDACDFVWDEEAWPDHAAMLGQWREWGFDTCFWVNPYLPEGTPIYEEAAAAGYLLQDAAGEIVRLEYGQPVGTVDFTNPAAKSWWKDHLKALAAEGASVFKPDYGDRVAEEAVFHNGKTGREMHNLYMFLYTEAAFEAALESRGEGITWRRSGYIGSQRYPGTWAGDTQVTWQGMRGALRGGLSAGFVGEAFWSHDIGGFTGDPPSPELYIRWAQFGLLSPFSRFHGTTPREPWFYGDEALAVVTTYARLRYALMPYLLASAYESTVTGLPMLRHMRLAFPGEPNADTLDDQYALGQDLLVAPVLVDGARRLPVYFPKGRWWLLEAVMAGQPVLPFEGPGFFEVDAPLGRMPVYLGAGGLLPRYTHAPQHLKGPEPREMALDITPGPADRRLTIPGGDLDLNIAYHSDGAEATLALDPIPVIFTIRLVDTQVDQVEVKGVARGTGAMGWRTDGPHTLITADARRGITLTWRLSLET
jgi:alpha-D-xyloside xylohydrolase